MVRGQGVAEMDSLNTLPNPDDLVSLSGCTVSPLSATSLR